MSVKNSRMIPGKTLFKPLIGYAANPPSRKIEVTITRNDSILPFLMGSSGQRLKLYAILPESHSS